MTDVLIIGQGAAGSFLALELIKRGRRVLIIDDDHRGSSSIVSAGIINPVTGKRLTVWPGYERFLPYARCVYDELARIYDETFFESVPVWRIFQNEEERTYWQQRLSRGEVRDYGGDIIPPGRGPAAVDDPFGSVVLRPAGVCHARRLLTSLRRDWSEKGLLLSQKFRYDDLTLTDDGVRFSGETFACAVFCEGHQARTNPWFDGLPFNCAKGEILTLDPLPAAAAGERMIINKGKWCAPGDGSAGRAGATYDWECLDDVPTDAGREEILRGLRQCLGEYAVPETTVAGHHAGVRPVIKDQQPVLGRHPRHPQLAIFNGLGSRGFLTAPLYAKHLAAHLTDGAELPKDVVLHRFTEGSLGHGQ